MTVWLYYVYSFLEIEAIEDNISYTSTCVCTKLEVLFSFLFLCFVNYDMCSCEVVMYRSMHLLFCLFKKQYIYFLNTLCIYFLPEELTTKSYDEIKGTFLCLHC